MPYGIKKTTKDGKKVIQVVTTTTGKVHGTYPDTPEGEKKAKKQISALYIHASPEKEKK